MADTLKFSCPSAKETPDFHYIKKVIQEAAHKQGDTAEVFFATPAEIQQLYKNGTLDGDCGRPKGYIDKVNFPDFVRITPAIRQINISLWAGEKSNRQIKQSRVGYLLSAGMMTTYARRVTNNEVIGYRTVDELIVALAENKIDYIISWNASFHDKEQLLKQHGVYYYSPLITIPGYIYIHRKHVELQRSITEEVSRLNDLHSAYHSVVTKLPRQRDGKIIFSCSMDPKSTNFQQMRELFQRIFRTLGYDFEMIQLSREREMEALSKGRVDGSCGRTSALIDRVAGLKVPVRATTHRVSIWSHDEHSASQLASLDNDGEFAYVRGTVVVKDLLSEELRAKAIEVGSVKQGLKMLATKRIDNLIAIDGAVHEVFEKIVFEQPIYKVNSLAEHSYYPVLLSRHKDIHNQLTESLEQYLVMEKRETLLKDFSIY